jgi:hypothetical protein
MADRVYTGRCIGGPCDGKVITQPRDWFQVVILEPPPLDPPPDQIIMTRTLWYRWEPDMMTDGPVWMFQAAQMKWG